jgi:TP901 family phage tail tape measure protein
MNVAELGVLAYLDDSQLVTAADAAVKKLEAVFARLKDTTVKVNVQADGAIKEVTELGRAMGAIKNKSVTVTVNTAQAMQGVGALSAATQAAAAQQATASRSSVNSQIEDQRRLGRAMAMELEEQIRRQGLATDRLNAGRTKFTTGASFASRMEDIQNHGYRNTRAGAMLTGAITAPLVGGAGLSLKEAAGFEENMNHLVTLTEITRGELDKLKGSVLALSTDPKIRTGPTELADSLYYVASTGLKGADAMEVLRASAMGASAGLGTTKVVANTITTVLDAYGLSADHAGRAVDTLTEAVRMGKGEADKYAAAFPKVIALAAQAGISFEEVAAQMASATRVGLTPQESGTALRQILNNLIDPSEKAQKALKGIGLTADQVLASLKNNGLFNTLKDLQERSGGKINVITQLFGSIRGLTGFLSTTGVGTLKEYQRTLADIEAASGSTEKAAGESVHTLAAQFDKLKASLQESAITLGTKFLPVATEVTSMVGQSLPAALQVLTDRWNAMGPVTKTVVKTLGLLLALAGPLRILVGTIQTLAPVLSAIGPAVTGMGAIKLYESLKGTYTALLAIKAAGGIAGAIGTAATVGPLVTSVAGLVMTLGIAAIAYEVLGAKFYNFEAAVNDAATATHNAAMATKSLNAELQRAQRFASGGEAGTKSALAQLAKDAKDADGNAQKMIKVIREAAEMKVRIGKDMKLDPIGKALLIDEITKLINNQSARTIELNVELKGAVAAARQGRGEVFPVTDQDREARAAAAGVSLKRIPPPLSPGDSTFFGNPAGKAAYLKTIQDATAKADAAILRAEQRNAPPVALASQGPAQKSLDKLTAAEFKAAEARANAMSRLGETTMGNKAYNPASYDFAEKVFSERERRAKIKPKVSTPAGPDTSGQAAEDARRISNAQQKTLQEQLRMWQAFQNLVDSAAGGIDQFDEKTKAAAIHAQLLKGKFEGIPHDLQAAAVALGVVQDRMKRVADLRDGLKSVFDSAFAGLVKGGYDTTEFVNRVKRTEQLLHLEQKITNLRGEGLSLAKQLSTRTEAETSNRTVQIEQLQEDRRKSSAIYGGKTPPLSQLMPRTNGRQFGPEPELAPFDVSKLPTVGKPKPLPQATAAGRELMGKLLGLQMPPGTPVTDQGMMPGETRGFQMTLQAKLMDAKFMAEITKEYRKNGHDLAAAIKVAQAAVKGADIQESVGGITRDIGRQIRLIGEENNPIAEIYDTWTHSKKSDLDSKIFHAALAMKLGLSVGLMRQGTKEVINEMNKAAIVRDAATGAMTQGEAARARALAQIRVNEYYKSDVVDMRQAAADLRKLGDLAGARSKEAFADQTVQQRIAPQVRDYDQSREADRLAEAGAATRDYGTQLKSLNDQRATLIGSAGQPEGVIAEATQRINDYETQYGQLFEKYGDLHASIMARDYADRQAQLRQAQQLIDLEKERQALVFSAASQTAQANMIHGALTPAMQRALDLEKYRQEQVNKYGFVSGDKMSAKAADLDAAARLAANTGIGSQLQEMAKSMATLGDDTGLAALKFDLYSGSLLSADAAQKALLLTQTKSLAMKNQEISNTGELVQAQEQMAESFARTARERLQIQFAFADRARAAKEAITGVKRDPAYDGPEATQRGALLQNADVQDAVDKIRDKASVMRDALRDGISTGFEQGVGKGLQAFGQGLIRSIEQRISSALADSLTAGFERKAKSLIGGMATPLLPSPAAPTSMLSGATTIYDRLTASRHAMAGQSSGISLGAASSPGKSIVNSILGGLSQSVQGLTINAGSVNLNARSPLAMSTGAAGSSPSGSQGIGALIGLAANYVSGRGAGGSAPVSGSGGGTGIHLSHGGAL